MATTTQGGKSRQPRTPHATTLEAILDAAWEGLLLVEEDGSIFGYNQRFLDLWTLTGTKRTPNDEETFIEHLERNADQSEPFKLSKINNPDRQRDSSKLKMENGRTLKSSSKPLVIDDETVGRAYRLIDITEHQQALERLDRFIRMASNDLREPLRTLSGHLHLLNENLPPTTDDAIQEPLQYALDSAHRMQAMIDQLVTYARASAQPGEHAHVDLDDALQEALESLERRIQETDAHIHAQPLPTLKAHRGVFVRLFQNLIDNAIKHNDKPRPWIWIGAKDDGDHVHIVVEDNGPGIPKQEQEAIFEMFHQGNQDDPAQGTGLGLALCREIVAQYGGDINVEATPGRGTRFMIKLPHN